MSSFLNREKCHTGIQVARSRKSIISINYRTDRKKKESKKCNFRLRSHQIQFKALLLDLSTHIMAVPVLLRFDFTTF